jgi:hypothetical protein
MEDMSEGTKIGLILFVAVALYSCVIIGLNYGEDSSSYEIEQAIPVVSSENNDLYEVEQATPIGVSQSYSPTIIYEYETKEYSIRQLRPEVFSVFAKEESFIYDDYNYAEALNNAIININPKYKIESTTALTSYYSQGSEARHLLVMVSPRNASVNS